MKRAFLDKLLARLRRIQPEDVEAFFVELARDKRFLETIFNASVHVQFVKRSDASP